MKTKILGSVLVVFLLFTYACKNKKEIAKQTTTNSCENVKWGYKNTKDWGELCTGFSACDGKEQSPVNIVKNEVVNDKNLPNLDFSYGNTPVYVKHSGYAIKFKVFGDNTLTIGKDKFKLLQFHYHALSEHTVDGKHYPMEVHFVHKGDKGLAVVGVFFEEGESNPLLEKYLASFPEGKGSYKSDETIELRKLLPENLAYYHYDGSLTTPPCSEIVDWYVLKTPLTASQEQLHKMLNIMHKNNRPLQPLNGRKILEK